MPVGTPPLPHPLRDSLFAAGISYSARFYPARETSETYLNPKHRKTAPHPFYAVTATERTALMAYLKSLDTDSH